MKTILATITIIGAMTAVALGAGDDGHSHDGDTPHDMRGKIMEGFGMNLKALGAMASGNAEFDAEDAAKRLMEVNAGATALRDEYETLWPEGSTDGPENEASPAIWEMPDEFAAAIDQFISDTTLETMPADGFELGAALGAIGKNCKSCHENFRVKRQ